MTEKDPKLVDPAVETIDEQRRLADLQKGIENAERELEPEEPAFDHTHEGGVV